MPKLPKSNKMGKKNSIDSTNRYERCVYESLKKIYSRFITTSKKNMQGETQKKVNNGVEVGLNFVCRTLKNTAFVFNFSFEAMLGLKETLPLSVTTPLPFGDEAPDENAYKTYLEEAISRLKEYLLDAMDAKGASDLDLGIAHAWDWALKVFKEKALCFGLSLAALKEKG